jgi:hypothetical protein
MRATLWIALLTTFLATLPAAAQVGEGIPLAKDDPRFGALNSPPDAGLVYGKGDANKIVSAAFIEATDRYAHGVLGDAIEAAGLALMAPDGQIATLLLEEDVFEDITPRLADLLEGTDNATHVVTLQSSQEGGGSLAVYTLSLDNPAQPFIVKLAQTPHIGTPNRWLNVAGIADYDRDGRMDIALVETPHIGGDLQFWSYQKGDERLADRLELTASLRGFSNHFIGSDNLELSATLDRDGDGKPELILPSADRKTLRVVNLTNGQVVEKESFELPAKVSANFQVDGAMVRLPLANGQTFEVPPFTADQ